MLPWMQVLLHILLKLEKPGTNSRAFLICDKLLLAAAAKHRGGAKT